MASNFQNLSNELAETVERTSRSIVAVLGGRRIGSSGIAWRDNLILTSNERVRAEEGIKLLLPDGRATAARFRGRDAGTDLALPEMHAAGLPALSLAEESSVKTGQIAIAAGGTTRTEIETAIHAGHAGLVVTAPEFTQESEATALPDPLML